MAYVHQCHCGGRCGKAKSPLMGLFGSIPAAPKTTTATATASKTASAAATVPATSTPVSTVTPQSIIAQICTSGVGKGNCKTENTSDFTSFLSSAISSRYLPAYTTATGASSANACAGVSVPTSGQTALTIGKAATSIGLTATSSVLTAVGAATSAIPIVGQIASLVTGVISMIVGHHSAAVKEQDQLLCQVVPATNNVLQQIDAALAAGTMTPDQAESQYSSFLTQFASEMQSDPSYKAGDAMNGYLIAMQCVIAARNQDLQNGVLTGGAPGPWTQTAAASSSSGIAGTVTSAVDSLESDLGISSTTASWLPWAVAGGLALLFLL